MLGVRSILGNKQVYSQTVGKEQSLLFRKSRKQRGAYNVAHGEIHHLRSRHLVPFFSYSNWTGLRAASGFICNSFEYAEFLLEYFLQRKLIMICFFSIPRYGLLFKILDKVIFPGYVSRNIVRETVRQRSL